MTAPLPAIEDQATRAPEPGSAAELAGALHVQQQLAPFSLDELEEVARGLIEHTRDSLFGLGDVLLEVCRRAGDRPSDRTRALQEFCARVGLSPEQGRSLVRVARAFPPGERERFPEFSWGHFRVLSERTAAPGDTPQQRQERIQALAEQAADAGLGVRGTLRLVEETLRPASLPPLDEFLNTFQDGLAPEIVRTHPEVPLLVASAIAEQVRRRLRELLAAGAFTLRRGQR